MNDVTTEGATGTGANAGSNIYDLGYRRYEGERLGRRYAIVALYLESLRGAFGLGRSTASKIAPAVLVVMALFPAIVQLIIASVVSGQIELFRAEEYYNIIKYLLALYCAVIAPDIAGRDQRNRSLTLYFSRAISRTDYAIAKLGAMVTAMLLMTLAPQLLLFIGNALSTRDFAEYARNEWDSIFPIVASSSLGALLIGSIGIAVAAYTPHRAFATVGIVMAFLLPTLVSAVMVFEIDTAATRYAVFLSPMELIQGFTDFLFRAEADVEEITYAAGFDLWTYLPVAVVMSLAAIVLLVLRYRRVQA